MGILSVLLKITPNLAIRAIKIPLSSPMGTTWERTRLHLFQFSLRDQASNWLERLPTGSISTWEDLTTRFFAHFYPLGGTAKLRKEILMFQQHQGESLSLKHRLINRVAGGKLCDKNAKESWEIIENLALYDYKGWNDSKDFEPQMSHGTSSTNIPQAYIKAISSDLPPQNLNETPRQTSFTFGECVHPSPQTKHWKPASKLEYETTWQYTVKE
ncbi:MAK10-like protein [Tanacetum coccineum]